MTLVTERPSADALVPRQHGHRAPRRWRSGLVGLVQLCAALCAFHVSVLERRQGSATVVALLFLLLVPGHLTVKALRLRPAQALLHLVYSLAGSITGLLAVVLAVRALAGPWHIAHPLATGPMVIGTDILVLLLAAVAAVRRVPISVRVPSRLPASSALLLLPLVTGAGAQLLENDGQDWLVILGLVGSGGALVWAYFQAKQASDGHERRVLAVLTACTLSMMWSYSLRSKGVYGFDVQQEYASARMTAGALAWNPVRGSAYDAMLSITALPTALWQMTGLSVIDSFKVLFPVVFSVYPAAIYVVSRRWLRPVTALVCTCLVFFTSSMAAQMPALGRQEIGLVLFVALLAAAFDTSLPRRSAQVFVLWLGAGMVVSHYSTTYVALGAFLLTRLISLVQRLFRQRTSYRAVLGLPVVVLLFAFSGWWTFGFTHSGQNVNSFTSKVGSTGAQVLPNSSHQSLVSAWLSGNVTADVAPQTYFDAIDKNYTQTHAWLKPYRKSVQQEFTATASSAPTARPWQPGLAAPRTLAVTLVHQATNLLMGVGAVATFVLLKRRRLDPELSAMATAMFLLTLMVRVSGSASFSYNPERLAMQSAAVLVIPLGLLAQWLGRQGSRWRPFGLRWAIKDDTPRRAAGAFAFLLLVVVFVDASGLGQRASGGTVPGNLSTTGEFAERFHADDQDIAAANWIAATARPALIVFADRYGALTVQTRQKNGHYGLFPDLAPGTIDQRGLVFASTTNVVDGRARGTTPDGLASSTYTFPATFLDKYKAVVFDTGWARVYS